MKIVQQFAALNRATMANIIIEAMGLTETSRFETIHNYIDFSRMILRKGAVRAEAAERLLIPINMRDGSLICIGKGNPDWNYSAPHGAGRLMSRSKAKEQLSMEEYQTSMNGIYTTSVTQSTIDEAPQAYKPMEEIVRMVADTVEIDDIIKPVYNFKAAE
jgi:RNA-splicing ligase RtcB